MAPRAMYGPGAGGPYQLDYDSQVPGLEYYPDMKQTAAVQDYSVVGVQHVQPYAASTNSGEAFLMEMLAAMDRHMQLIREHQQALVATVETACRRALGHNFGRLVLVGSAALRVETPGSDVDVVCFTQYGGSEAVGLPVENLRKVHSVLWNMVNVNQETASITMELIDDARVPILRVLWGLPGSAVAVDVSVDQARPVEHIRWFQRVGAAPSPHAPPPVVAPLVTLTLRCVKWWLRQRQIPRTKEGGLPTIAWLLMAVHVCSLPTIHEQAKVIRQRPMAALLALLMAFFQHYAATDGLNGVLSFTPDGSSSRFQKHEHSSTWATPMLMPTYATRKSSAASDTESCQSSTCDENQNPNMQNVNPKGPFFNDVQLDKKQLKKHKSAATIMWSELSILDPTTKEGPNLDLAPRVPPATQVLLAHELQRAHERLQQVSLVGVEASFGTSWRCLQEIFEAVPEGTNMLPSLVLTGITALLLCSDDPSCPPTVEVGVIESVRPRAGWTAPFLLRSDHHSELHVHLYDVEERTGRCQRRKKSLVLHPCHFVCCVSMEKDGKHQRLDADGHNRYAEMRRYVTSLTSQEHEANSTYESTFDENVSTTVSEVDSKADENESTTCATTPSETSHDLETLSSFPLAAVETSGR